MPSETLLSIADQACQVLAPAQRTFCAACESALAQGEEWYSASTASEEERAARVRAELGRFAEGHIDPRRFAALFAQEHNEGPEARKELKRALDALREACAGCSVMPASVENGRSLAETIDDVLSEAGRVFAAARVIEQVRSGRGFTEPLAVAHLSFRSWTRNERRYAPPVVVTVAGSDLHAGALSDYADGRVKIVLVVEGACPPAALIRLVTPGMLVMQTSDVAALERVAQFDGPAVAAIVPESSATFTHDPALGAEPWQRVSIQRLPALPIAPVPGMSAWQLREDVRQLQALAAAPSSGLPPGAPISANAPDAVDRLASWLLSQSDLTGLS
jgi:hypothetical protein